MPAAQGNDALVQLLQAILGQLGGSPVAGRAAAGIAPPGPEAPTPTPAPEPEAVAPPGPIEWSPEKRQMYREHGLGDPERLEFTQQLANFMGGLKFRQRAMQSALQGRGGIFGSEGDILPGVGNAPGGLGSYA